MPISLKQLVSEVLKMKEDEQQNFILDQDLSEAAIEQLTAILAKDHGISARILYDRSTRTVNVKILTPERL